MVAQSGKKYTGRKRGAGVPLPMLCAVVAARELDRREADAEAMAAFEGAETQPDIPEGIRWRDWCDLRGEALVLVVRERVLPRLRTLADAGNAARLKRLEPVLATLVTPRWDGALEHVVLMVVAMDLESTDGRARVARDISERVQSELPAEEREPGIFGRLAACLLEVTPGARGFDPWVRDGSRLLDLVKQAEGLSVAGLAVTPDAYAIALARLLLAGVRDFSLELGDGLRSLLPSDRSLGFDCIVAMPPVGLRMDEGMTTTLPVPAASSEMAAVERVALSLRGGGRAAMLLPSPALSRGGRDAAVRRWLLKEYRIDGVLELGDHAFGTDLSFEMLLLSRELPGAEVRFLSSWDVLHASAESRREGSGQGKGFDELLRDAILGDDPHRLCRKETVERLLERDANLLQPLRALWQEQEIAWRGVVTKFVSHAAECPLVALGEAAELFGGASPERSHLRAQPALGRVPYIRIRDIEDGAIRPASQWLDARGVEAVPSERRLRPGDLVLTTRGGAYRSAIVANGAVGAVVGSGVRIVRVRREDLTASYLHTWLASPRVRARLVAMQTGSVVTSLRNEALASLEVAVPSIAVQARAARAWRDRRVDAVDEVLRAIEGAEEPDGWLEAFIESEPIRALVADESTERAMERVDAVLRAIPPTEVTGEQTIPSDFIWRVRELLPMLSNLAQVPDGALRCAGLLAARMKVRDEIEPHHEAVGESLFQKLNPIARALDRLLGAELDALLRGAQLSAELVTPATLADGRVYATLRLRNVGTIALREVELRLFEGSEWINQTGGTPRACCAQNEALSFELAWPVVAGAPPPIDVLWSGLCVDGRSVTGEASLRVSEVFIVSRDAGHQPADLGANPYVVGDPARDEMFFGREDVLLTIEGQLASAGRSSVILLEGARRSGKTSIQFQLMRRGNVPDAFMVRCDLQRIEGDARGLLTTDRLWRGLAGDIAARLVAEGVAVVAPGTAAPPAHLHPDMAVPLIVRGWFRDGEPFEQWEIYLDEALRALAPRRLVLILDEFDRLAESIDQGALPLAALGQLRALLQRRTDVCVVLTGTRAMTRLRNDRSSPLFGMGFNLQVGPLPPDDARSLVTRPVEGRLVWTDAARDRVVEVCGQQPFMIQSLCAWIFKDAAQHDRRVIDGATVDQAVDAFSQDHGHFQTLWKDVSSSRQRLVLAFCADAMAEGESRALDAAVLEQKLLHSGVSVPDEGLGDDLEALRRDAIVELLSRDGYQRYRLTLPLFGAWIRRNQDRSVLARHAIDEASDALEEG